MADTLPFSEKTSSGTSVLIQGVECGFINVPLHSIYLSSDLVTDLVAVGIRHSLPFNGVHLLLGNDLAGDRVVVDPLLTSTPCVDQPPDPIEQEIPDRYPSCAVTRATGKKANQNHGMQDIDLTDTLIGQCHGRILTLSRNDLSKRIFWARVVDFTCTVIYIFITLRRTGLHTWRVDFQISMSKHIHALLYCY